MTSIRAIAAGKTQRWGRDSVNPELPPEQQERNRDWLLREMADLRAALERLEANIDEPKLTLADLQSALAGPSAML